MFARRARGGAATAGTGDGRPGRTPAERADAMYARMTHRRAIRQALRLIALMAAASVPACNAPDYTGIPIEQFLEWTAEDDAHALARATSQPTQIPTTRPSATPPEYRIGPSDVLFVTVYGLDSLEAPTVVPARVGDDGTITLPMVGAVRVADLSLANAEKAVARSYSPRFLKNPRVLVEVKEYRLTSVLVIGGPNGAKDVALRRNERSVFCSLAKAQVASSGAAAQQVFVQPASDPNRLDMYDLTLSSEVVRLMNRPPLEEGDIVIARPAPPPMVYVFGLSGGSNTGAGSYRGGYGGYGHAGGYAGYAGANMGGALLIPETGLRLRQAIAASGGVPIAFDADKIVLTRRLRDGRDAQVVFKWKELAVGKVPDVELRPGDIIEIPHTAQTRTEEILRNAIVLQAGLSAVYNPISQFVPQYYRFNDDRNNGYNVRQLVLSDLAVKAANKITSPVLGP